MVSRVGFSTAGLWVGLSYVVAYLGFLSGLGWDKFRLGVGVGLGRNVKGGGLFPRICPLVSGREFIGLSATVADGTDRRVGSHTCTFHRAARLRRPIATTLLLSTTAIIP
ncbi:hypothetical protein TSUD_162560 [Trifolium subterraneum]|uniref:Uncharacterized protein n=1 Tax=Trifolium subterraneum TaxID=3900 RepID=A0A2Z6MSP2_TRISU|nr:hypothetical protein TSUD_162560 [Trifolium subterraneum]